MLEVAKSYQLIAERAQWRRQQQQQQQQAKNHVLGLLAIGGGLMTMLIIWHW